MGSSWRFQLQTREVTEFDAGLGVVGEFEAWRCLLLMESIWRFHLCDLETFGRSSRVDDKLEMSTP